MWKKNIYKDIYTAHDNTKTPDCYTILEKKKYILYVFLKSVSPAPALCTEVSWLQPVQHFSNLLCFVNDDVSSTTMLLSMLDRQPGCPSLEPCAMWRPSVESRYLLAFVMFEKCELHIQNVV